MGRKMIFKL